MGFWKDLVNNLKIYNKNKCGLLDEDSQIRGTDSTLIADGYITKNNNPIITRIVYATASGNDDTGDGTLDKPYRTFVKCINSIPDVTKNTVWFVDITGIGEEVVNDTVNLPTLSNNIPINVSFDNPSKCQDYFRLRAGVNVVANPIVLHTLDMSTTTFSSQSGTRLKKVTDTSQNWVPGELKGKTLYGSVLSAGVIYDNDETSLKVCTDSNLSGDLKIVEQSATLKYGLNSTCHGLYMSGLTGSIQFIGINFSSTEENTWTSLSCDSNSGKFYFSLCNFETGISLINGGYGTLDHCTVNKVYAQDGTGVTVRNSLFTNCGLYSHGSGGGGIDYWKSVRFEGTKTPLGHGGNGEPEINFHYRSCSVSNSVSHGLTYRGHTSCRVEGTDFNGCGGNAINAESVGRLIALNISGSDIAGYGIVSTHGAQVKVNNLTTVTGELGDFKVGVMTAETWNTFNSAFKNRIDTVLPGGTFSRLFNISDY